MSCEGCEEGAYVIDALAKLLAEIAIIVNGTEPHDTLWSYHDLPDKVRALKQAQQPAALANASHAWAEGYRAGVMDERTSEASIGIAGFGAKIEPARENPYGKAQQPAAAVPAGYALVPVEPTDAMLEAAEHDYNTIHTYGDWDEPYRIVWDAMLAAARKGVGNE